MINTAERGGTMNYAELLERKYELEARLAVAITALEVEPSRKNQIRYAKALNSYILLLEKM